jgi:retron-type reverse transcriptase
MTPEHINIAPFFTTEALKEAFFNYKEAKTDKYDGSIVKIPMGADGVEWQHFEKNIDNRVKNIERAVLEDKYIFYPLREIEIPKPNSDKTRTLSVASIRDVLVQKQLYEALQESSERIFSRKVLDKVSLGYRKGKSIRDVALGIRNSYENGFGYVLDADLAAAPAQVARP